MGLAPEISRSLRFTKIEPGMVNGSCGDASVKPYCDSHSVAFLLICGGKKSRNDSTNAARLAKSEAESCLLCGPD